MVDTREKCMASDAVTIEPIDNIYIINHCRMLFIDYMSWHTYQRTKFNVILSMFDITIMG